jgi:predicted nucleotide-binding protein (sugar kinase/HSP70/actin superfamily)
MNPKFYDAAATGSAAQKTAAQRTDSETAEYLRAVEENLKQFELEEGADSGPAKAHWRDLNPTHFVASQRAHTTILHAGLTMAHDLFIQSAFRGLGYKVEAMDVPDNRALQFGREFGNRGQCNPTYFTVGNLVKKLKELEAGGLTKQEIVQKYIFATAGSCGPCRFGTYVTEYRKALRDAGFEGFRVILFQQAGGIKQATGEELGLKIDAQFFITIGKAILLGDVLNALMYRIRPYEVESGATDAALDRAKARIARAFETRKGLLKALWQTRRELAAIKVDRTRVKPRVAIIGEFWAMTTEGDGNYKMQRFLEQEGAEVDIQLVTNWILYLLWGAKYDTLERAKLKGTDRRVGEDGLGSKFALENVNVGKKLWMLRAAELFVRGLFYSYAKVLGLRQYHLPDMDHIAEISHSFYDNNLRGGEGHMEVGKLIHNVVDQKVNMTLSIKPFGCMPSSAVSDGVQSLITELYPSAIFLPIETNGDGAVNVYSRVQMQLFKARQSAEKDMQDALQNFGWSAADFQARVARHPQLASGTYCSTHAGACTALDLLHDVALRERGLLGRLKAQLAGYWVVGGKQKQRTLAAVSRAAENFRAQKRSGAAVEMAVKIVEP